MESVTKNKLSSSIFLFLLVFLSGCKNDGGNESRSEIQENSSTKHNKVKGCGFATYQEMEANFLPAEDRIKQIVDNIIRFSGLPNNFMVKRSDYIDNAFATVVNGERVIVYDSKLFENVEWYSDTYWTSVSILAHEIGHHLSGHTEDNIGSTPHKELEADQFSGFVLYKMGATLEQTLKAMNLLGNEQETLTHPSKNRRLQAITKGWNEANEQRFKSALPPAPKDSPDDFYIITKEMVIDNDILVTPDYNHWFQSKGYLYGVVIEARNDSFIMRVLHTSKEFENNFRKLDGEDWEINIESPDYGSNTQMCKACAENMKVLLKPGRRLEFSMVESLPGHGASLNGVWFLTHARALAGNYFE